MQKLELVVLVVLLGLAGVAMAGSGAVCQTYTIKSGDSPYGIAEAFNILPDNLAEALSEQGLNSSTLQPGQVIYLYPYYGACQYVTSAGNDESCQAYMVQTGDTLAGIASEFDLYVGDLLTANPDIASNGTGLKPGAYIKLPPWADTCPDPGNLKPCQVYTAAAGDSLSSIATEFEVTVDELIAVNTDTGLTASSVLAPNQPVKIYPYYKSCPEGGIPATPPTNQNTNCRAYIVEKGDTLASIAALFGVSTSALITVNPQLADPSLLTPGFEVLLPPYPNTCTTSIVVTSSAAVTPTGNVSSSSISYQSPAPSPSPTKAPEAAKKAPAPAPTVAKAPAHAPSKAPASAPAKAPTTAAAKAPAPTASGKTTAASTTSAAPGMVPSVAAVLALLGAAIALL